MAVADRRKHHRPPTVDLGPAAALSCRECGHRVPLGPVYACQECFGPLEIAYDFPAVTRGAAQAHRGRPAQHLALRAAAAGARRRRRQART